MKALIQLFILLFAAVTASASTTPNATALLDSLPPCSINCIVDGVTKDGCSLTDLACGCSKINELTKIVSPCMATAGCTLEQMTQTASTVAQFCESAGLLVNGTSSDAAPTTATGAAPAATTTSGAGRLSDEIILAFAAVGVLMGTVFL
ncbi:cell wall protein [Trichoderma citrinoviride]|uniref:Cell wall protein n=1 Tax=Trichoderma citrinoviride TaxID=58853 RepID=A0A2T4BGY5_9HYPO|nr:cell wall protein [Trichoderma citrinoviride]PTB68584.1 cell wall protein [Trichoderma citrinoviride]